MEEVGRVALHSPSIYPYRSMRIAICLGHYGVEGSRELERKCISLLAAEDVVNYEIMYRGLIDELVAESEPYKEIMFGFRSKHLASTGAIYGQIYERHPDLVKEVMPLFARYFHQLAIVHPSSARSAWWYTSYGPGFDSAISANFLSDSERNQFLESLEQASTVLIQEDWDYGRSTPRDNLEQIFKRTGLIE